MSETGLLTRLIVLFAAVDCHSVVQLRPYEGYMKVIAFDFTYSGWYFEETPFDCLVFRKNITLFSASNVASFMSK